MLKAATVKFIAKHGLNALMPKHWEIDSKQSGTLSGESPPGGSGHTGDHM